MTAPKAPTQREVALLRAEHRMMVTTLRILRAGISGRFKVELNTQWLGYQQALIDEALAKLGEPVRQNATRRPTRRT